MKTPTIWRSSNAPQFPVNYNSSLVTYSSPVYSYDYLLGVNTTKKQPTTWAPITKTATRWTGTTKTPLAWTTIAKTPVTWNAAPAKTPVTWSAG